MPAKLHRNIKLVYGLAYFHSFMIIAPVMVPFFISKGLSLAEVFYLQAVYATTIVLLEATSGYFADHFGRRRLLIVGSSIHGLSYFFLNFAQSLEALLLFEVILGVASSLLSGADLALLYDLQKAIGEGENDEHSKGIANLGFSRSSAEGIGALLGGLLAMWSFELMVITQSVIAWFCIMLASLLIEPAYKSEDSISSRVKISYILRYMLAGDTMLRRIVIAIPLYNLTTFLAVWLIQPYWEEQGLSLGLFGHLWCLQSLTTASANKLGFSIERKYGAISALVCIGVLPIAGHLDLALLYGWQGIIFGLLLFLCRGFNQVILVNALNRRVPSEFRATANSLTSFVFRFAFIVTGPFLGYVAEYFSITSAFLLLAGATLGLFVFVMLPLVRTVQGASVQIAV